jgi:hypothetical protein
MMMGRRTTVAAIAAAVAIGLVVPAAAQFGWIFGDPPRPPSNVPGARPQQPYPQQPDYPPPPANYPPANYPPPPDYQPGGQPPGVQSRPLPPPSGAALDPAPRAPLPPPPGAALDPAPRAPLPPPLQILVLHPVLDPGLPRVDHVGQPIHPRSLVTKSSPSRRSSASPTSPRCSRASTRSLAASSASTWRSVKRSSSVRCR